MNILNIIYYFFFIPLIYCNDIPDNDNANNLIKYNYILLFYNNLNKKSKEINEYYEINVGQKKILNNLINNFLLEIKDTNNKKINFNIINEKPSFFSPFFINTINIFYKQYLQSHILIFFNDVFMNQKKFYNNWINFQEYIINLNNELINNIDNNKINIDNINFINDFLSLSNNFLKINNNLIIFLSDKKYFLDILKLKMCSCNNELLIKLKSLYCYPYYLKLNIDKFMDPNIKDYFYFFDFEKFINNSDTIIVQFFKIQNEYIKFIFTKINTMVNDVNKISSINNKENALKKIIEYYNFIMENLNILYKIFKNFINFLYELVIIYSNNSDLNMIDNLFTKIEIIEQYKSSFFFNNIDKIFIEYIYNFRSFINLYMTFNKNFFLLFSMDVNLLNFKITKNFLEIFILNQMFFFVKFLGKDIEKEKQIKQLFNIFELQPSDKSNKECQKNLKLFLVNDCKTNILILNSNKDNPILSNITIFPINDFINILYNFFVLMEPEINLN